VEGRKLCGRQEALWTAGSSLEGGVPRSARVRDACVPAPPVSSVEGRKLWEGRKLCGREEALWKGEEHLRNRVVCSRCSVVIACDDRCTTGRLCVSLTTTDTR
jgi:hypothetical protein